MGDPGDGGDRDHRRDRLHPATGARTPARGRPAHLLHSHSHALALRLPLCLALRLPFAFALALAFVLAFAFTFAFTFEDP
ncbi:hypothetical protein ACFSTC_52235 [Nonomuraea ferruginea]